MRLTSVIIPAHNEQDYIRKTIESFRQQQFKRERRPYELIVVANGCDVEDNTASIAQDLGAKVIELAEGNVSRARNKGAQEASGEILIFNDADTPVASNYVDRINLAVSQGVDYGATRAKAENLKLGTLAYVTMLNFGSWMSRESCGNMFVRHDSFEEVNGFNEELRKGEDTALSAALRVGGNKFGFLWSTYTIPSARTASLKRTIRDSYNYAIFRITGKLKE